MTAPISSAQFTGFHGASRDFDEVRPAIEHKKGSVWEDLGKPMGQEAQKHAYATTDEDVAWRFAKHASDTLGGRGRVYTVEAPQRMVRPGRFNSNHPQYEGDYVEDLKEHLSPQFKVTGQIDIKPGAQGTFPQEDWNKYLHEDAPTYWYDANHPEPGDDAEVAEGLRFNREIKEHGYDRASEMARKRSGLPSRKKPQQVPGQLDLVGGHL